MIMGLFTVNAKLKKSGSTEYMLVAWSLPAGRTCPGADQCRKGCYAMQGLYNYPSVKKALSDRFELSKSESFAAEISKELVKLRAKAKERGQVLLVRIHAAGDFYSKEYLSKWVNITQEFPDVLFYAYTKSVHVFKEYGQLPPNFRVLFSEGGKHDDLIDRITDRHVRVFSNKEELDAAGYIDGTEDDTVAALSPSLCIGLVYHGVKSKTWNTDEQNKEILTKVA